MGRVELSGALARALVEAGPDALVVVDHEGRIVLVNAQAERLFGHPRGALLGQPVEILLPVGLRGGHEALRDRFLGAPEPRSLGAAHGLLARRADGSELPVDIALRPFEVGGEVLIVASVRDVSDHLRMREALARAEAYVRELVEQAADGIFVADLSGRYIAVNTAGCRMLGYTREEILGLTIVDLLPPEDVPRLQASRAALEEPGHVEVGEWALRRKDGAFLPVEVSGKILADGRWQGIVRDISERKRAEQAREQAAAELERLRAEWSAVVAHDLRQPLSAIAFNAQLLARDAGDAPALQESIADIAESAGRLNRMILDLLDVGRVEAHQLALQRAPVELAPLVRKALERAAATAGERSFELVASSEVPAVLADGDRVTQVLDNLVSNAVKYGAPGTRIEVALWRVGDEVAVAVTNEGAGLEPAEIHRLFQRFHRTEKGKLASVEGVGLGLYIARALVEAHGGRLDVESTPGRQTTFRFTLPVA